MASKARLKKAIAGLHKEIGKLEPQTRQTILGHLEIIQTEIRGHLAEMTGPVSGPNWVDTVGPPPKPKPRRSKK